VPPILHLVDPDKPFVLEVQRILSEQALLERATAVQRIREDALYCWFREAFSASFTDTDYRQLHGYLPHLSRAEAEDFAVEALGHLMLADRCPDGDPARERNEELFFQRVSEALQADAEAAGGVR
jgi:hypothetical protein